MPCSPDVLSQVPLFCPLDVEDPLRRDIEGRRA